MRNRHRNKRGGEPFSDHQTRHQLPKVKVLMGSQPNRAVISSPLRFLTLNTIRCIYILLCAHRFLTTIERTASFRSRALVKIFGGSHDSSRGFTTRNSAMPTLKSPSLVC